MRISENDIYLLIKYIKSVLWRVAKRLSYIEDARCLKVNSLLKLPVGSLQYETAAPKSRIPSLLRRRNRSKAVSSLFLEQCYQFKVSGSPVFPDRDVGSHLASCWRQVADALRSALCRQKKV